MKRRDFLKLVSVGTCGAAVHNVLSPTGGMMAFADVNASAAADMVMVVVNLSGGCSYNIAPPFHGAYYAKNPNISYTPATGIALAPEQGLHPSLTGFKTIWDEGNLAVLNLVGYPNANRSHDESTDIWFRGLRNSTAAASGGWAARLACVMNDSIFNGISLVGQNTLIQGGCNPPRALGDLNSFGERNFWNNESTKHLRSTRDMLLAAADEPRGANGYYVRDSITNLDRSIGTIRTETNITLPVTFPNTGFGRTCQDAAKLIAARSLKTRFIFMQASGYDTHSDERPRQTQLLAELNGGLTALANCCKALGRWQNVMIITMSEFCRTFENGSMGTDHGHAAPMFVMGGRVVGGIKNAPPNDALTNASNGFYEQYDVDFREVFGAGVAVMGLDPASVFSETYVNRGLRLFA